MPSIINSDDGVVSGTSGLKTTGGNDGLLNIQSNGSTVVAVTGSGISVTGTVSQTGVSTFAAGTVSAPSITFTGDTNTGIFSPAADTIAFTEGGVESMRIDASGNVGVGVTPSAWSSSKSALEVGLVGNGLFGLSQTAGYVTTNNYYNSGWKYAGTGAASLYEKSGTAHRLYSADSGTAGNAITWTQIFEVNKGKSLALEGASAQTGTGITFPATQSASTDANTLDDYEEGTWTPTLGATSSDPTGVTYSTRQGSYTKIGRQVTVTIQLSFTTYTGGSGDFRITGLPFTSNSTYLQIGTAVVEQVTLTASRTALVTAIPSNETRIYLYQYGSAVSYINTPLANMASSGTTKYIDGEITYFT